MVAVVPFLALTPSQIVVTNTSSSSRGFTGRAMGDMIQIQTSYNFNPLFGTMFSFLKKTWVSTIVTPAQ